MPHPGNLAVQTNALSRLIKEEKSYYTELHQQEHSVARLEKIKPEDIADGTERENHGYRLKQEVSQFPLFWVSLHSMLSKIFVLYPSVVIGRKDMRFLS